MLIKTFLETAGNFNEREILIKFHEGIKKHFESNPSEIESVYTSTSGAFISLSPEYEPCDIAVMLGSWKGRDRPWHLARTSIAKSAGCFVVIETPLLGRAMFQPNKHHRVGVNGFLNNDGTFINRNFPSDRLKDLGITWEGWKNKPNGHILVLLQLPGDASLRNISIYDWARDVIEKLSKFSNRKILIRTHPGHNPKDSDEFYKFIAELLIKKLNVSTSIGKETSLVEDLKDAYCTISYSSGSGIDSIVHGIPTIATDPGNFAWNVSTHYLSDIENIKLESEEKINQWLYNLAYSQWSPAEMESGRVWTHLLPIINKRLEIINNSGKKKK